MVDLQELPRVIEDLRHHTPEQLAELRLLLNVGLDRADIGRAGFFEIDGGPTFTMYFGILSATKFCLWPPGTARANPGPNSWRAHRPESKEFLLMQDALSFPSR